ncbi:ABC transporter ATP-binding protein [Brevibacterium rongguiense]|uniref:ABC transporter ATP-binding protein n=1 Tax=Brevibacterium rongguiense TaxID=2695267 RepID=UPI002E2B09E6|nr:ABC transporter ATP-binding protein [Brevibacterium rongguiense]
MTTPVSDSPHPTRGSGLTAADVRIGYDGVPAVEGVDLAMRPGEVTALVGPNGSGKSTLLRALARLHPLTAGSVAFGDGTDLTDLPSRALATRLTMLTQMRPTPQGVRVRDAVALGRHPHRGRFRAGDPGGAEVIARAMRLTGVDAIAGAAVDELSGGQLQRVWLASCLAQDTEVLLLDEPTNHLDMKYQVELLELLSALAHDHGVCVGVVLHDLNHAAAIADRVALLSAGSIAAEGTAREVLRPDLLSQVYDIDVTTGYDEDHDLVIVRARPPRVRRPGAAAPEAPPGERAPAEARP